MAWKMSKTFTFTSQRHTHIKREKGMWRKRERLGYRKK